MSAASETGEYSVGDRSHHHVVGFYRRDHELISAITPFLSSALNTGGTAIVLATPTHRAALEDALVANGCPLDMLISSGHFRCFDAAETLAAFMCDGKPDPARFASTIGAICADSEGRPGSVHAFGEMVSLLWDEGNIAAAIELESLWNELAADHDFELFCAYRMSSLELANDLVAAKQVCDRHSIVIPLGDAAEHLHTRAESRVGALDQLFVPTPSVIRDVRTFVREVLVGWGEGALVDEAQLIVSELSTNAIVHARSPFLVSICRTNAHLRIAVRDVSTMIPTRRDPLPDRAGGRGIPIVASTANAWDIYAETDGKTIWATLTRSPTRDNARPA